MELIQTEINSCVCFSVKGCLYLWFRLIYCAEFLNIFSWMIEVVLSIPFPGCSRVVTVYLNNNVGTDSEIYQIMTHLCQRRNCQGVCLLFVCGFLISCLLLLPLSSLHSKFPFLITVRKFTKSYMQINHKMTLRHHQHDFYLCRCATTYPQIVLLLHWARSSQGRWSGY